MSISRDFDAVLFDLDGTLVDTAPDLVAVLQAILTDEGREPIEYPLARSHVSHGSAGLIRLGFPDASSEEFERLRLDFLDRYQQAVCVDSQLFPELDALLGRLDSAGLPWGVVTNKPGRMTAPLMESLDLHDRAACTISGDTIAERKPHPAPLYLACDQIGIEAQRSIYIGDAERDIEAGRTAGMYTVAVTYGYIPADEDPYSWNAHRVVEDPKELSHLVLKGVNLSA